MPSLVRLSLVVLWVLSLAPASPAATQEVRLQAPLTTVVRVAGALPSGAFVVRATVQVPMDAPADLGVGGFVADRHGRWYQRVLATPLQAGANAIVFAIGPDEPLVGQPHHAVWNAASAVRISQAGLFFWSPSATGTVLQVDELVVELDAVTESVGDTRRLMGSIFLGW